MTDLVVVTDLPTPYREPVFAALAERLRLHVVYVGQRRQRSWDFWRCLEGHDSTFVAVAVPDSALEWTHATRRLWRRLSELAPRVVVAGGWSLPTSWTAVAWGRSHGVPVGLWIESTAAEPRRHAPYTPPLKRLLVSAAAGAVVPGRRSADYASAFGARRVTIAPNAVRNEVFASLPGAQSGPPRPRPRVLYVGRLAPEKGLETLVDAAPLLARRRAVEFVVVGDGPLRDELEGRFRRVGADVTFAGSVSSPQAVAAHLHDADVLVLPSSSEPWGLVVNEAMAAQVPAVVSDRVGCGPDLVVSGLTGEVFPCGDAAALAMAIDAVIARGRTAEVRSACRAVADAHAPERCADGFVDFARSTGALVCG